ncbi:MAG: hypothetical protein ACFNX9_05585 [Eikenella corrodens]
MQQNTCPILPTHMMKISLKLTFQVVCSTPPRIQFPPNPLYNAAIPISI